jgi:PilZ domain
MQEARMQDGGQNPLRYMEHRWGTRLGLSVPVQIEAPGLGRIPGLMVNASVSGAFIRTALKVRPLSAVRLIVVTGKARIELPACVARTAEDGLGVEWRDMACPELLEILNARGEALTQPDRVFG